MIMSDQLKKRIDELRTIITLETHEKFRHIINMRERDTKMIDYLGEQLSIAWAKLEIYEQ